MLRIGLVSYEFINNDIRFNLSQIEKAMKTARGRVDFLCFGETFLQGFDALDWTYGHDAQIAVAADSPVMQKLCDMTREYGVDLLLGYIEKEDGSIYSSCAFIEKGNLAYNYRRISRGWKEYSITDEHYKEGHSSGEFLYQGYRFMVALCGDLWDFPEKFKTDGILIWPVYVNFSLGEWEKYEAEYAQQAFLAADRTLMVNSISQNPRSYGGAFCFAGGKTEKRLAYDTEDILIVEV